MSRYIDADALHDSIVKKWDINPKYFEDSLDAMKDVQTLEWINSAPSIELVRCGECKFKSLYDGETKYYYCALEDRPNRNWSVDDWNFCYWGARKESE